MVVDVDQDAGQRTPAVRVRDAGEPLQREPPFLGQAELRHARRVGRPCSSTRVTSSPSRPLLPRRRAAPDRLSIGGSTFNLIIGIFGVIIFAG